MHKRIKEVIGQGRKHKGSSCIKDKDSNMLFYENYIKKKWEEYATERYNDTTGNPSEVMNDEGEEIMRLRKPPKT